MSTVYFSVFFLLFSLVPHGTCSQGWFQFNRFKIFRSEQTSKKLLAKSPVKRERYKPSASALGHSRESCRIFVQELMAPTPIRSSTFNLRSQRALTLVSSPFRLASNSHLLSLTFMRSQTL